jgi:hypothetical protein
MPIRSRNVRRTSESHSLSLPAPSRSCPLSSRLFLLIRLARIPVPSALAAFQLFVFLFCLEDHQFIAFCLNFRNAHNRAKRGHPPQPALALKISTRTRGVRKRALLVLAPSARCSARLFRRLRR